MSLGRVLYRVRQFFLALRPAVAPQDLEYARLVLTPAQMALFAGMQSSEQAHAVSVYRQLVAKGETSSDLLAAALLHDVGKSLSPLRLWDRVLIVLARVFFPVQSRRWGKPPAEWFRGGHPPSPGSFPLEGGEKGGGEDERGQLAIPEEEIRGWRRAFVVGEQHPAWGARLAAEAGASPCTVALIRLHQEPASTAVDAETIRLLSKLQAVDNHN